MAATDAFVCAGRRARAPCARRWLVTLVATVASTYALDAVATAAGVLLVASGLLPAPVTRRLAFLAASYVVWARRPAREPAGELDAARADRHQHKRHCRRPRTTCSGGAAARARRLASAVGYVGTEVAKEVPYYAGAFGAAVLSDSVSSTDALVFLGGANLGAAGVRVRARRAPRGTFLRRRSAHASFDTDWVPKEYLTDYYSAVEPDELRRSRSSSTRSATPTRGEPLLFFGVGPTLHHVFLAAGRASEIHLADYLPANLGEIERWLDRDPDAHDWRPFVRYTLECERAHRADRRGRPAREQRTRERSPGCSADARRPASRFPSAMPPSSAPTARTRRPPTARPGRRTCGTSPASSAPGGRSSPPPCADQPATWSAAARSRARTSTSTTSRPSSPATSRT